MDSALAEFANLRFAVGAFDSWSQLRVTLDDLHVRGLVLDSFNCLSLQRIFAGNDVIAAWREPASIQKLAFPCNGELIGCTSGPLADCLAERLRSGAPSLKDALGYWLLPRHAAHFQGAVESGEILFWIRLVDAAHERCACQSLLAKSSNTVGVHDLVAPSNRGPR
jgi:hypothetical protein